MSETEEQGEVMQAGISSPIPRRVSGIDALLAKFCAKPKKRKLPRKVEKQETKSSDEEAKSETDSVSETESSESLEEEKSNSGQVAQYSDDEEKSLMRIVMNKQM